MTDPYAILGVKPGTSPEDCKKAFRNLAKTCHPDLFPNDPTAEARFKEINTAYEAIANPQPMNAHSFHTGNNSPWQFFYPGGPGGRTPFDDLFAQMRRTVTTYEIRISLEEAFHGKETKLSLPQGKELKVVIPRGIDDGTRLVMAQSAAAEMHIIIRVLQHERFARFGSTLTMMVPVTAFDVLLGNEIEVNGIDGHQMRVAIPANFDSSRKLRLAGQGMVDNNGQRGDLLVELFVQYPTVPADQLEALRDISKKTTTFISP